MCTEKSELFFEKHVIYKSIVVLLVPFSLKIERWYIFYKKRLFVLVSSKFSKFIGKESFYSLYNSKKKISCGAIINIIFIIIRHLLQQTYLFSNKHVSRALFCVFFLLQNKQYLVCVPMHLLKVLSFFLQTFERLSAYVVVCLT